MDWCGDIGMRSRGDVLISEGDVISRELSLLSGIPDDAELEFE